MSNLEELLKVNPHLESGLVAGDAPPACATGFTELDAALPGGGWPAGLIWANCPVEGVGELRLLMPAAGRLTARARRVVFLNPPYRPYAPALAAAGVAPEHVRLINPARFADSLWAADKLVRSEACGLVLFWRNVGDRVTAMHLRRLQLGARQGGTHLVVYNRSARRDHAEGLSAWATLALRLQAGDDGRLAVDITRARGLARPRQVCLSLSPSE